MSDPAAPPRPSAAPEVAAREAILADLPELVRLYRLLEEEMQALESMWNRADALAEPIEDSFAEAVGDPGTEVLIGTIDGLAFGFLLARVESLLAHESEQVGAIRLVFTEPPARGVGVGEALRDEALRRLRERGIRLFDAHVLPGHRLAKNFFEAGGFSARHIVMFSEDESVS